MSGNDANITFPNSYPVQGNLKINDFISLDSGDVAKVDSLVNPNSVKSLFGSYSSGFSSALTALPTKFKVYRGAIELSGDTPFELSNIIDILFTGSAGSFTNALAPSLLYFDIIFNPDGSLNNSTSEVYLHLHNLESPASDYSRDAILAVRKMSGSIGVYEVGPTGAPYQFAIDPRNKGI